MPTYKITVIKRALFQDIVHDHCQRDDIPLCPEFSEGQEFVLDHGDLGRIMPEGFCTMAWNNIRVRLHILRWEGEYYGAWLDSDRAVITCCTDGVRPVIFKLERFEDDPA